MGLKFTDVAGDTYVKLDRDLKDILISALRYALPRHTYIVDLTCSYIKSHAEFLDDRVIAVMLRDIDEYLHSYKDSDWDKLPGMYKCDVETIEDLRRFLEDYAIDKIIRQTSED